MSWFNSQRANRRREARKTYRARASSREERWILTVGKQHLRPLHPLAAGVREWAMAAKLSTSSLQYPAERLVSKHQALSPQWRRPVASRSQPRLRCPCHRRNGLLNVSAREPRARSLHFAKRV